MNKNLFATAFLSVVIGVSAFTGYVYADIPKDKIDNLSDSERQSLSTEVYIAKTATMAGSKTEKYSSILDEDLSLYSIDELKEISEYIDSIDDDKGEHVDITICDEKFSSELRATFLVYSTISDIGGQLEYVGQNHNPELSFDNNLQEVGIAHIYLTYFGDCSKDEVKDILEEYTDEFMYAIPASFPDVSFEILDINWKIPAIDEDNMYSASYWCVNDGVAFERGDGKGIIYY